MKWTFAFLLSCAALAGADLASVRTVYLLPMGGGLDQYLANQLTRAHIFQVVTDPKRADAVLTERIGPMFEARMDELYPPPPTGEEKKAEAKKEKEKEEETAAEALGGDAVNRLEPVGQMAVFGRGKGTVFLVDAKSREVLWSAFEKPAGQGSLESERAAAKIVEGLKKDISGKKK